MAEKQISPKPPTGQQATEKKAAAGVEKTAARKAGRRSGKRAGRRSGRRSG